VNFASVSNPVEILPETDQQQVHDTTTEEQNHAESTQVHRPRLWIRIGWRSIWAKLYDFYTLRTTPWYDVPYVACTYDFGTHRHDD
jgi:hypothetical protein